ncbi:MAG: hypothetical protein K1X68_08990 [Saprospiraceae bacterium]|nr:hypothetical protein [Saprospiraceae bacterium]HMW38345.1 hypothetical protein [Saprospiraceae bacterium]HNA63392.1 hypothetical protein [Saprospiraceae bacterium]HNB31683.1 hypothetical protein [Saprospiraceae bacterium]HNE62179.1 hypothetical protein [Saprospiraceae bacterium]
MVRIKVDLPEQSTVTLKKWVQSICTLEIQYYTASICTNIEREVNIASEAYWHPQLKQTILVTFHNTGLCHKYKVASEIT